MAAENILIVEDESAFAQVLESYLTLLGYHVVGIVDNGEDALRVAATSKPDLALLDIEIHGKMDGFDVAERFAREFDIPVVFLTGRGDDTTLDRVRQSGSFGYLLKPFRLEELKATIELALIRHGHDSHLRRTERFFSAALMSINDGVIMADTAGAVTFMNPAAERFTGATARKAQARRLAEVFQTKDAANDGEQLLRAASRGAFVQEGVVAAAGGRETPVEVSASAIRDEVGKVIGSVLVFRDITERKRLEAELKKPRG